MVTVELDGVNESSTGSTTCSNAAFLGQEIICVSTASSVREQETPLGRLIKVEPRHVTRTDPFILNLGALI